MPHRLATRTPHDILEFCQTSSVLLPASFGHKVLCGLNNKGEKSTHELDFGKACLSVHADFCTCYPRPARAGCDVPLRDSHRLFRKSCHECESFPQEFKNRSVIRNSD